MTDDTLEKDEVKEKGTVQVAVPSFPTWMAVAYLLAHPWKLVWATLSCMLGFVFLAVLWGFTAHMIVDAWNFAWDLWGSL